MTVPFIPGQIGSLMARMGAPPVDPELHEHQKGLRGGLLHMLGADKVSPEVAALLTPDQISRVRPGVASTLWNAVTQGRGPQSVMEDRAHGMLGLQDEKKARDKMARDQRIEQSLVAAASQMEPQAAAEFMARGRLTYGLPNAAPQAQATDQLRTPDPMQVSRGAAVRKPDGTWEIPSPMPAPAPPAPRVITGIRGRDGKPVTRAVDMQSGQVFWEMPEAQNPNGNPMGRPPTEAESKDYVFAGLMRNAMPDIRSTAPNVRPQIITALRVDPTGALKIAQTDDERVFIRAVLEFSAAANRKESGAAITPSEVQNTLDRYVDTGFDGPADSPVRKAKARARENYLNLLENTSKRARAYYEGGAPAASEGKPMTQAAYDAARKAGYTDEEIRAEGYVIPGAP